MRAHIVVGGVIVNTVVVEALADVPGAIDADLKGGSIGDLYSGGVVTKSPVQLPTQAEYTKALEDHYDTKAKEKRYDTRYTCAIRAGYVGPFQAEGHAFAAWMDACNALAYSIMGEVLQGHVAQPTIPELLAQMPVLTWP